MAHSMEFHMFQMQFRLNSGKIMTQIVRVHHTSTAIENNEVLPCWRSAEFFFEPFPLHFQQLLHHGGHIQFTLGRCGLYAAEHQLGFRRPGGGIRVSDAAALRESLISVGTAPGHRAWADDSFRLMRRLFDACQDVRRMGCASLDLCYVACGRQDGFVERRLQPWDYAAGLLIVAEAGGQATDLDGAALPLDHGSGVAASNGLIHSAVLAALRD